MRDPEADVSRRVGLFILCLGLMMLSAMESDGLKARRREERRQEGKLIRGADLVLVNGKLWTGGPVVHFVQSVLVSFVLR